MKLTLAEPKLLVDSIGLIGELVSEAKFKFDKDKIELIAMDPANVAMVVFKLLSSAFSEYKIDKEEEIGLSLESLKAVLKRVKSSDVLSIELDKERNRLRVQLKGESSRTFHLGILELEDKNQKIPELQFAAKVETGSAVFEEAVGDMDIVSESVSFLAEKGKFTVEAAGSTSDARVELSEDGETSVKSSGKDAVRSRYSIEYLKRIIRGGKLAPKLSIQFSKDYPLRVDYLVKDKLSLAIILAPRVSTD